MKLNHTKLRALAAEVGIDAETLAESLPRELDRRKESERALRSVRNWLSGKDHPHASKQDIEAMAAVLGVEATSIARFSTTSRFVRSSPRKARLMADLVRGRNAIEARDMILPFSPRRAAVMVRKAVATAIADAEANDAAIDRLVITESHVDGGPIIKRFQPKDRGRAHPIQKKTCHITIAVEEAD